MYIIKLENKDPYFNLALEEYFLTQKDEEFFVTAINKPSILIGANQNTYDEINALYVKQNGIPVIRRLSGGGTIFVDEGNLNFSHIFNGNNSDLLDFSKTANIIIDFFTEILGLKPELTNRNDLSINEKKICGQTRFFYKNRIVHDGTILISSNKKSLIDALKYHPEDDFEKGFISNHENVSNINEFLQNKIKVEEFWNLFINYLQSKFPDYKKYDLTTEDIDNIKNIVNSKYSKSEWNYGERPKFNHYSFEKCTAGNIEFYLNINEENIIENIRIFGNFFSIMNVGDVENLLQGIKFEKNEIYNALKNINFNFYFWGIEKENFVNCIINSKKIVL